MLGGPQLRVRTLRRLRPPLSQAHTGAGGGLTVPGGDQSLQGEHPCRHPLLYIVGTSHIIHHPSNPFSCPSWELDDENSTNFVLQSICVGEPGEVWVRFYWAYNLTAQLSKEHTTLEAVPGLCGDLRTHIPPESPRLPSPCSPPTSPGPGPAARVVSPSS